MSWNNGKLRKKIVLYDFEPFLNSFWIFFASNFCPGQNLAKCNLTNFENISFLWLCQDFTVLIYIENNSFDATRTIAVDISLTTTLRLWVLCYIQCTGYVKVTEFPVKHEQSEESCLRRIILILPLWSVATLLLLWTCLQRMRTRMRTVVLQVWRLLQRRWGWSIKILYICRAYRWWG